MSDIESLYVRAASLRGVRRLTGLRALTVENPRSLQHLRGHRTLESLALVSRGWHKPSLDIEPITQLPALRELEIRDLRLGDLGPLSTSRLETLRICFCEVPAQSLRLPVSLVELDLDDTTRITLAGVCPALRLVDLWGTEMEPVRWIASQPAVEELWLVGCEVPTLEPLLAMQRPPRWIFMDGDGEDELLRHRFTIAQLEARGAQFALGSPHDIGIWIPSSKQVSERNEEPLYLSPSWPRSDPDCR